ncbi:MAG TPA: tyrosine-type recombinase/integrase [Phenylobacterium sp.]|nr:tyrosine-type recombinase/integrase [Phenylobacterium sp.]HEX2560623.1 tyrosine-type recombinase/integrase [Phenylobacterium sp.]
MARRIMQMASAILRYGVATSRCARDPTADLRGALKPAPPPKHRAAIRRDDLPEFLRGLEAYDGEVTTKLALMLVLYTFVRTAEIRFARWSEFENLEGREPLWRIPAERMKMRRPHLVPLAPQVVEVLRELRRKRNGHGKIGSTSSRSSGLCRQVLSAMIPRLSGLPPHHLKGLGPSLAFQRSRLKVPPSVSHCREGAANIFTV